MTASFKHADVLDSGNSEIYDMSVKSSGPEGRIPFTEDQLIHAPGGDIFGQIQNVGMGWSPTELSDKPFLILSTMGGIRTESGKPIALGYHTGHWELDALVRVSAMELSDLGGIPFAVYCSDPCDGRTQGTTGMMDSLAYRNDAAIIFRRLIRSLPTCRGVLGIATCDKGLPAMMMALAAMSDLPCVLVPGGVMLAPTDGEDIGKIQSIAARFAHREVTLEYAREMTCRACASPGGGCQFLGTAASSQVVGEALGLSLPHSALVLSGQKIWLDVARRSARALLLLEKSGWTTATMLTKEALINAMTVYAAFGGSTNLLLHIPAFAHAAELERPTVEDWQSIFRRTPRLVDALPNGPNNYPTAYVYLAGGVPEVMLHLRDMELLEVDIPTVSGQTVDQVLNWWRDSKRRRRCRQILKEREGIDPDDVIMSPHRARERGSMSTMTFPAGNIVPDGSVIKSTAIDPSVFDGDGIYRKTGPARVFVGESAAMHALKLGKIKPGDVMVLICVGPMGSGMEETFQITAALRHLSWGKHVAVVTDGRFSGVSTGACIGHAAPEALAGGPIGKLIDGDILRIVIDCKNLNGRIDLVGEAGCPPDMQSLEHGNRILASRSPRADLIPHPALPDDTRLWAYLQNLSGGPWGGCVYDVNALLGRDTEKQTRMSS